MRRKIIAQQSLFDYEIDNLLVYIRPNDTLKIKDKILEENKEITKLVHEDLTQNVKDTGANGMSAEQVLRSAIIKQWKGFSYRELAERIHDGITLRWFTRFKTGKVPHFTALQKAIKSISCDTFEKINDILVGYAKKEKLEKGKTIRTDTTVVETNILYPVDARILDDSVRTLTRIMLEITENFPKVNFGFANRTRKSKKFCYQIVLTKGKDAEKKRKKLYRKLISASNEVFNMGCRCLGQFSENAQIALLDKLDHFLNLTAVAIEQCERRVIKGEKVPADEKIVSIFEPHTDIICRGKTQSPAEFGHKVLFTSGKSGLVTQFSTLKGNPGDNELLPGVLKKHKQQYGKTPFALAGDRRFFSAKNEEIAGNEGVKRVCIKKPGYRSKDRKHLENKRWFKKLCRFRAGIEGTISGLARGSGLKKCLWKGWESFKSYVGLGVITFNLRKIANLLLA